MSKQLTPEVETEILQVFKRTRSPFKTATEVAVDVAVVWAVIDKGKESGKLSSFEERHGGRGRPEMRQFLVATRRASDREWDNTNLDILQARAAFEDGTHTLATGRDGQWLLLYAIPLNVRQPRPGYFKPEQG